MKPTSAVTCAGISLIALFGLASAGYGQSACKDADATPAGLAAARMESVKDATPQALAALRGASIDTPRGRIVGGHATLISDNPWQIAMIRSVVAEPDRSQFCGGSIIGNDWILTAAHCVRNSIVREDPTRVDVVAGTRNYAIGGERLKVAAIHTHPKYNGATMDFDFALLRLRTPMTKGQAIALADQHTPVPEGTNICVSGWGATAEGAPGALELLGAFVPTVSTTVCNEPASYNGDILPSMFCAGLKAGGVDSCQGDSGGPASTVVGGRNTLVGVVSWGEGCARRLKYGVYSKISMAAEWIAKTIGK